MDLVAIRSKRGGKYRGLKAGSSEYVKFVEEIINGSGDVTSWKVLDGGVDLRFV
jgi:hypothetical protein